MARTDLTAEEKAQFHKEQEERVDKLRRTRPQINIDNIMSQEEVIRLKEEKRKRDKSRYWNYHKKPSMLQHEEIQRRLSN